MSLEGATERVMEMETVMERILEPGAILEVGMEMGVIMGLEPATGAEMAMDIQMDPEIGMDEFLRTIYYHNLVSTHIPVQYDNSIKFTKITEESHPLYGIRPEPDVFKSHAKLTGVGYGKGSRDDGGNLQGSGTSIEPCGYFDGTSESELPF